MVELKNGVEYVHYDKANDFMRRPEVIYFDETKEYNGHLMHSFYKEDGTHALLLNAAHDHNDLFLIDDLSIAIINKEITEKKKRNLFEVTEDVKTLDKINNMSDKEIDSYYWEKGLE